MIFLIDPVIVIHIDNINIFHFEDFAAWALFLGHSLAILVGYLQLTQKAYDLIAVVALFGLDGDLFADHAR